VSSAALLLAGLIPDPTESVQFRYPVVTILEQISGGSGGDKPHFISKDMLEQVQNSDLIVDVTVPNSALLGRKSRVLLNAEIVTSEGSGEIRDLSGESNLHIRAQMVFPRQFVEPAGYSSRKLSEGTKSAFRWNLFSDESMNLMGKLWVYLDLSIGMGTVMEYPLLAKDIEIPARTILGMSLVQSRIAAMILIASGICIVLIMKLRGKIKGVLKIVMIK
jgi:hypothetical protein